MGKTISEKILSGHANRELKAGEISVVDVDVVMSQDGTGPLAISQVKKMGFSGVKDPSRSIFFIDHAAPSPRKELSNSHSTIRTFADQAGAVLNDIGKGVCHQILIEEFSCPGDRPGLISKSSDRAVGI